MAQWHDTDRPTIYVGDTYGNPVTVRTGIVTVNRRTSAGFQVGDTQDQPDYTLDVQGLGEVIAALNRLRSDLIKATGGL